MYFVQILPNGAYKENRRAVKKAFKAVNSFSNTKLLE